MTEHGSTVLEIKKRPDRIKGLAWCLCVSVLWFHQYITAGIQRRAWKIKTVVARLNYEENIYNKNVWCISMSVEGLNHPGRSTVVPGACKRPTGLLFAASVQLDRAFSECPSRSLLCSLQA